MTERITAWQCIGCGRIEGAQPCVGICQDRRAEFVHAADHDAVLAQLAISQQCAEALAMLARQIAYTTPRDGECERTWRALQANARKILSDSGSVTDGTSDMVQLGADSSTGGAAPGCSTNDAAAECVSSAFNRRI